MPSLLRGFQRGQHDVQCVEAELTTGPGRLAGAKGMGKIGDADTARVGVVSGVERYILPRLFPRPKQPDRTAEGVGVRQADAAFRAVDGEGAVLRPTGQRWSSMCR